MGSVYALSMFDSCGSRWLQVLKEEEECEATPGGLHGVVSSIDWSRYVHRTVKVNVKGDGIPGLNKGVETMVTVKHAINSALVDPVQADFDDPDTSVVVRCERGNYDEGLMKVTVMVDVISTTSTSLLRDYRSETHPGSLRSTTAALAVVKSGFPLLCEAMKGGEVEKATFVDPMCGSGTIVVEAMRLERGEAVVKGRVKRGWQPCFARWKSGKGTWDSVKGTIGRRSSDGVGVKYVAGDIVGNNVRLTREAVRRDGQGSGGGNIEVVEGDVRDLKIMGGGGGEKICVTNPPWGGKISSSAGQKIEDAWDGLGEFCKRELKGGEAWIIAPKSPLTGRVKMKETRKVGWKVGDGSRVFARQYHVRK